jgi:hypothetical protein
LPAEPSLNAVVCHYLQAGGMPEEVYPKIRPILLDRGVEAFLDDLLEFVEDGKVVPIRSATTAGRAREKMFPDSCHRTRSDRPCRASHPRTANATKCLVVASACKKSMASAGR